jgi:transcriptional regulator with XRE-family HTH domain
MTYEAYLKKIAKLIRTHRIKMGYSMPVLAEKVGLTKKHIEKYEGAKNLPRFYSMYRIAEILEIPPDEIFTDVSRKSKKK